MGDTKSFDDIVEAFSQNVGIQKAEHLIEDAAVSVGLDIQETYTRAEVIEMCEYIHQEYDGYIPILANDLRVQLLADKRFGTLFENIPNPTVSLVYEPDTPIVRDVNRAFEDVFGHRLADIVGHSLHDYITPVDDPNHHTEFDTALQNGEKLRKELRVDTPNGTRDFIMHAAPNQAGEHTTQAYVIYADITETRRRERELKRQNERLDKFASVVSHDLRNPLNVAHGYVEKVQDTGDLDDLDNVKQSLERMETIIENVLTLARHGDDVGDTQPVALATIVDDAWDTVTTTEATLDTANLPPTTDDDAPYQIEADPNRLQQLLENLFRNAVEHAGPEVTVSVGQLNDRDGFYVSDTGPGIPAASRDTIFEHGVSSNDDGTGLGLSIVSTIVDAHDWAITVTESASGGARFEITTVTSVD